MKGESEGHAFFSADSNSYSSTKLESLTMGSPQSQMKHNAFSSDLQYQHDRDQHHFYSRDAAEEQPKKVMHHFLDEWAPKETDSWSKSEEKMPSHRTQLSISIPNSLHDFFVTQK